ncbi:hypothetical protein SAMN02745673_01767 [Marinactinospora thermotolerans DSM 45154]|uniref:Uncharacterized protein n=1 Tax=Marinactinospora thermotolerans DSM 45154 TaxID=1122192 RepID=A0A1T4PDV3_9ACTN|nr:hypothetical protein SAMN02745673_01767 [Marinactinospora thermotolerans DSM 45154]
MPVAHRLPPQGGGHTRHLSFHFVTDFRGEANEVMWAAVVVGGTAVKGRRR